MLHSFKLDMVISAIKGFEGSAITAPSFGANTNESFVKRFVKKSLPGTTKKENWKLLMLENYIIGVNDSVITINPVAVPAAIKHLMVDALPVKTRPLTSCIKSITPKGTASLERKIDTMVIKLKTPVDTLLAPLRKFTITHLNESTIELSWLYPGKRNFEKRYKAIIPLRLLPPIFTPEIVTTTGFIDAECIASSPVHIAIRVAETVVILRLYADVKFNLIK